MSSEIGHTESETLEQLDYDACGIVGRIDGIILAANFNKQYGLQRSLEKLKKDFIEYAIEKGPKNEQPLP